MKKLLIAALLVVATAIPAQAVEYTPSVWARGYTGARATFTVTNPSVRSDGGPNGDYEFVATSLQLWGTDGNFLEVGWVEAGGFPTTNGQQRIFTYDRGWQFHDVVLPGQEITLKVEQCANDRSCAYVQDAKGTWRLLRTSLHDSGCRASTPGGCLVTHMVVEVKNEDTYLPTIGKMRFRNTRLFTPNGYVMWTPAQTEDVAYQNPDYRMCWLQPYYEGYGSKGVC